MATSTLYLYSAAESVLICLFTLYLVYTYAHKATSCVVKLVSFIGWFLGFSIIFILPIDILAVRIIDVIIFQSDI